MGGDIIPDRGIQVMAESVSVKMGRIMHDLFLINSINNARQQHSLSALNKTHTPDEIKDYDAGWKRQQDTLYKATVRRVLGDSNKGQSINVQDFPFILTLPQQVNGVFAVYFAGGVLDVIHTGSFPPETSLQILSPMGAQSFYNVGGIHHASRTTTKRKK